MGSCNIMGNTDTLKILRGKDKIKWVSLLGLEPVGSAVLRFCGREEGGLTVGCTRLA